MVTTSHHWSLSIPKRFLFLLLQCTSCRRAMVNKIWCQDVARKLFHERDQPPPHGRMFSEPKCQNYVATWYLLYRGLVWVIWMIILIFSIFEIGSESKSMPIEVWPIYLTNWQIVLGCVQALVGFSLTLRRWIQQKSPDFDSRGLTMGWLERTYWFLFVQTMSAVICVSVTYWLSVYDPELHHIDPPNILMHICNTILMFIDFYIVSIPFKYRHFWWTWAITIVYPLFSLIYYWAGGLDKMGRNYIYEILNWEKPLPTILACIFEAFMITVVHWIMCLLQILKNRLYAKVNGKSFNLTQTPVTEKRTDIV